MKRAAIDTTQGQGIRHGTTHLKSNCSGTTPKSGTAGPLSGTARHLAALTGLLLCLFPGCGSMTWSWNRPEFIEQMCLGDPYTVRNLFEQSDSTGRRWVLFPSSYYGFVEFWLASAEKESSWSRPLYTGIPAYPGPLEWGVEGDRFWLSRKGARDRAEKSYSWLADLMSRSGIYVRDTALAYRDSITFSLSALGDDGDGDGLTDSAEFALMTDPKNSDSDGDGAADGVDRNPLAVPADELQMHGRLHKFIIEKELVEFRASQLVLVEQWNGVAMEYRREQGLVLSLSPAQLDSLIVNSGYGIPILTAAIKDTLRKYKVSYQFFVAPDDAWGYEALYDWNPERSEWVRKRVYWEWDAELKDF